MNRDWTVDTCVLYEMVNKNYNAFYFLDGIIQNMDKVALDQEQQIEKEYKTCMDKIRSESKYARDFISYWFTTIVSRCFIKYCGDLDIRHKKALKKLNFHNKDLPFVAVCKKTKDKNLVSKDSGYNNEVKKYLLEKMEVHVLSIQDSLNFYK
jgi:hypothetical protein